MDCMKFKVGDELEKEGGRERESWIRSEGGGCASFIYRLWMDLPARRERERIVIPFHNFQPLLIFKCRERAANDFCSITTLPLAYINSLSTLQ